jgi:hypothetical protein
VRRSISFSLDAVAGTSGLVYDAAKVAGGGPRQRSGEEMSGGIQQHDQTMSSDFEEHLKTYHAFLRFLLVCGVSSAVVLLLMYFFLAR